MSEKGGATCNCGIASMLGIGVTSSVVSRVS